MKRLHCRKRRVLMLPLCGDITFCSLHCPTFELNMAQSRTICADNKIIQDNSFPLENNSSGAMSLCVIFCILIYISISIPIGSHTFVQLCPTISTWFCEYLLVFVLLYPSKCDIGCGVHLTGCRLAAIGRLDHIHLISWPKYIWWIFWL